MCSMQKKEDDNNLKMVRRENTTEHSHTLYNMVKCQHLCLYGYTQRNHKTVRKKILQNAQAAHRKVTKKNKQ